MNSFSFLKGGPLPALVPCGLLDLLCARLDPLWTRARPVWTSGLVLDPYWLICVFLWTIGELLVGSLLDRIGFLGHFVIGLSIGNVCVIAVL